MARTIVVTGSASGIGRATAERFRAQGDRVIGVDLRDADVLADLSSPGGRDRMVQQVAALAPQGLGAVVAAAGVAHAEDLRQVVATNYFGAVATLEGLRPLLQKASHARAVVVLSTAVLMGTDDELVAACLRHDEDAARTAAAGLELPTAYASSKRALGLWMRAAAVSPSWAGCGIPLNGVAPGTVRTPMTEPLLATAEGRAILDQATPIAVDDYGRPEELAEALVFLGAMEGRYLLGQVVYVDGGTDALTRPSTL